MRRTLSFCLLATLAGCGDEADPAPSEDTLPAEKLEAATAIEDGKADWSLDLCERRGWYGDGECDWFCFKRDPDCNADPLGPEPEGVAASYPILLGHGFDASPTNRWGWYQVEDALSADGHVVASAIVPPYASVKDRAGHLARAIDALLDDTGADRVNLISHSMGGLDARYVISTLGYGDRVASLTTISTPHRGSAVADVALKLMPGLADRAINALATAWGRTYSELAEGSDLRAAMNDISESATPAFNAANPNDPSVYYQSWAGVSSVFGVANNAREDEACEGQLLRHPGTRDKMDATLVPMAVFTAHGTKLLPNDGMVTVESAKWGAFRGCIPADHLDEVGQVKDDGADQNTGFDHLRFLRNLSFELAAKGY